MTDWNDFNARIIEEFRANSGRVGGMFDGAPMVLLTTTGARTGAKRTTPLMYLPDGERLVIFASKGGAPTNPDWYHNLVAHPEVTVEVGDERFDGRATVLSGEERERAFAEQRSRYPQFGEYEAAVAGTRTIPVIALSRD